MQGESPHHFAIPPASSLFCPKMPPSPALASSLHVSSVVVQTTLNLGVLAMKETRISLPELVLVAGTRVVLGVGAGLLLSDRFSRDTRRAAGWLLFLVGAFSTIPLALEVFGDRITRDCSASRQRRRDEQPIEEMAI
jgi:hypothetical protein